MHSNKLPTSLLNFSLQKSPSYKLLAAEHATLKEEDVALGQYLLM